MSRIAKQPVVLPKGTEYSISGRTITVKNGKNSLSMDLHPNVEVEQDGDQLNVSPAGGGKQGVAIAGTMRSLLNNMTIGVTTGYERRLNLVGVGYRAQAQGQKLNLTLGFSHPVVYQVSDNVSIETPSQTEIVLKSADKQRIGQVAAEIRAFRPPEPYKGKGVRYADERVILKEAKKK